MLTAFILAVPVGALIGFAIAENRYFAEVAKPLLFFAFSIPKSIFLPMFILVFGVGFAQKVGFGFFSTIFIVIMSTTTAVESVKVEHLTVARSYGATPWQTAFRVYLPSMLPVLLEALRISMIFNLTGVILAEMYASREGIGHQIATWGENFQMKQLLAGVIMIAVIAMTFNELVRCGRNTMQPLANVTPLQAGAARRLDRDPQCRTDLQDLDAGRRGAVGRLARRRSLENSWCWSDRAAAASPRC